METSRFKTKRSPIQKCSVRGKSEITQDAYTSEAGVSQIRTSKDRLETPLCVISLSKLFEGVVVFAVDLCASFKLLVYHFQPFELVWTASSPFWHRGMAQGLRD